MTDLILAVIGLALAAGLSKALHWAFWPRHSLPRNRVRHQRIRLYLRLHPGPGHATAFELWRHWGRLASARKAKYARPSLALRERLLHPEEHSVTIGRAHYFAALRLPVEEHAIVIAPPRTGKTGWLSSVILGYPGPVVSTTTRVDVYKDTSPARRECGRIDIFNPQRIGRVPSTFTWDPIPGCEDPATAIRRADAFAHAAVSGKGVEDGEFFAQKCSDYLRAMFFAAAWARLHGTSYGLSAAARWALTGASQEAEEILDSAGAGAWSAQLAELRSEAQKTAQTIRMYMSHCLGFLADPALATAVHPQGDDPGLDLESFVRQPNTIYLVASGQGQESPLAPLFAALTSEVHHVAGLAGSWSPGGRLPRPLLFALDEVTQICPVPLDQWMADSGGKGIQVIAVAHGVAQLRRRWGTAGARVIQDCAGAEIVLPGIKDEGTLRALSELCGTVTMTEHGADHHSQHPIMTPAMIRGLPDKRALVIRTNRSPAICRIRQVWDDKRFKQAASAARPQPPRVPVAAVLASPASEPSGEAA